jgi:hypothetical protein
LRLDCREEREGEAGSDEEPPQVRVHVHLQRRRNGKGTEILTQTAAAPHGRMRTAENDGAARGGSWTEGKLTFIGKLCESPLRRIIVSALSAVVA